MPIWYFVVSDNLWDGMFATSWAFGAETSVFLAAHMAQSRAKPRECFITQFVTSGTLLEPKIVPVRIQSEYKNLWRTKGGH